MKSLSRRGTAAVLLSMSVVASCGSSSTTSKPAATTAAAVITTAAAATTAKAATSAFPVTVAGVTIKAEPKAIVSLSPTATEMLFAVGAGKQVIAVDDQSNFPAEAPKTDLSGFKPNIEAIAAKKPDLVVIADDAGKIVEPLTKLGINVITMPPAVTMADSYAQLEQLGAATGHVAEGVKASSAMKASIDAAFAKAPKSATKLKYYHELDPTYFSVTSKTFIGQVYNGFGLENIADSADKDGSGYPQLSAEAIVAANPDLVFLADTKCCQQTVDAIATRPGWNAMKAVTTKGVVALDDDIASRWGPRLVLLVEAIGAKLAALQPA
jgi:iron complex transport system substrate-binding protein